MKLKIFFSVLLLIFVLPLPANANEVTVRQYEPNLTVMTADSQRQNFTVEIAATAKQQERGLMERWALEDDGGMLFIFPTPRKATFWMKNTYIPLDMIFIEHDGRIQHIHHMAEPQSEVFITSPDEVSAVLEINGGMSEKLGIAVGDTVYHSFFKNLNLLAR